MEEEKSPDYHLSQVLKVFQRSARTVDALGNLLIAGSEDNTVKIFELDPETKQYKIKSELNDIFQKMIYVVKVRNDGKGFFVGGQDKLVYVLDEHGTPISVLEGHQGTVNSISQIDETHIATGSWDGTAKVWDFTTGQCEKTLDGHSHATAVLALKSLDLIITGSQDKSLKFFTLSTGELKREIKAAHLDIIRQLSFVENVGFLSCSNDESVKLWAFDGDQLSQCLGHKGFVFAVNCIMFGKYVSGGDDRMLKIWNDNENIQTIEHPSSIWNIAVNGQHDIITSCGDGVIRVFSNDPNVKATEQILAEFNKEVEVTNQASQSQQMSQEDINKLPMDPNSVVGQKDGEYKMFRDANGNVAAYMWVAAQQKWEKIGDVTGTGSGAPQGKRYYPGDQFFKAGEYDYIFDVEDDTGIPKLIPFNDGDSSYLTARTYCAREGISFSFQQQIQQFLENNSKSGQQKQQQQIQQQHQQNVQSFVKKQVLTKSQYFPSLILFKFTPLNKDAMLKKILENNQILVEQEKKDLLIMNIELKRLESIIEFVADPSNQAKLLDTAQWDMFTQRLLKWPMDLRIPIYDMLRVYIMHPQAEKLFTGLDSGMDILLDICTMIQSKETIDGIASLLLKLLANGFQISNGKQGMQRNYKFIIDALREVAKRDNNNVKNSLASLLFNYSVDVNQRVKGGQARSIGDYTQEITQFIVQQLQVPQTQESELKILVALGNLVDGAPTLVRSLIVNSVNNFSPKFPDEKNKLCYQDLKAHSNFK